MLSPLERELLQLTKQYENLKTVINSLRSGNYEGLFEAEQKESERLHTAIDAMRTAIENKGRELYEALQVQKELEKQLGINIHQSQAVLEY